jgi:hypothetical protein
MCVRTSGLLTQAQTQNYKLLLIECHHFYRKLILIIQKILLLSRKTSPPYFSTKESQPPYPPPPNNHPVNFTLSVFNLRNILPKSGTFLLGHPLYIYFIFIFFSWRYTTHSRCVFYSPLSGFSFLAYEVT